MALFRLSREPVFPNPEFSEPDGLLAVGGDLSSERLLQAYACGVFPWYSMETPILWWSPDPRLVLFPAELHVPRSLRRIIRSGRFTIRCDTAFEHVVLGCAEKPRPGQEGTWIVSAMIEAYVELHRRGFAHSIEAWEGQTLAGGLYGVSLGAAFFGESMFTNRSDASKVAFVTFAEWLRDQRFELVDCQVTTKHLTRFGAREISRREFLDRLAVALQQPTRRGNWQMA